MSRNLATCSFLQVSETQLSNETPLTADLQQISLKALLSLSPHFNTSAPAGLPSGPAHSGAAVLLSPLAAPDKIHRRGISFEKAAVYL